MFAHAPQHTHTLAHTLTHTHIISHVVAGQANKLIFHIFFGKTLHELYIKVIMWSRVGCMCVREREREAITCVCACVVYLGSPAAALIRKAVKNVV